MIGFVHIPKTGGSSVRKAWESSGVLVWRPRGAKYNPDLTPGGRWVKGVLVGALDQVDVVTGHICYAQLSTLPIRSWVTVLRDPVDRWVSHYRAMAGQSPVWPNPDVVPSNLTCRMLTDMSPDLEAASTNITRFDHVGFFDRLHVTFAALGLSEVHARHRESERLLPGWVRTAAIERNDLDQILYDNARAAVQE